MRNAVYIGLCVVGLLLGGCAFLDALFGINQDGTQNPGGGPVGTVGSILGLWIPGASAVATGLGGIYAALRGRKWKALATSTIDVIENASKAIPEVKGLKKDLGVAHAAAGVGGLVESVVAKYGHSAEAK